MQVEEQMMVYRLLADVVLFVHFAFIAFVVFGQLFILAGLIRRWRWVRNFWFRAVHLAAIGIVVAQSWLGITCPLTTLEKQLKEAAGEATYSGDFIAHWMHEIVFYSGPTWVFTLCYSLFGLLVIACFIAGPPRWPWRAAQDLPHGPRGHLPIPSHGTTITPYARR